MAEFSAADVAKLRELTGAGLMDCKKALVEANGNLGGRGTFPVQSRKGDGFGRRCGGAL
jgi:hypothetical protein